MLPYSRDPQVTIPTSSVKIIGLGGAGANILERMALDGLEGADLLALNTDIRTLESSLAKEKIQLGLNLTKGLGTGGDPELGQQAVLEAEDQIRASLKGRRIIFLCTGLGGGTGSGASSIVTRIAREEGAFVVVFATMPFAFEGKRRREQAETALNELAVLSNALVTFDNNRMGELVLAKQGIHEAFVAADYMISESIKAVIRLVVRPGIINVGLDDLMSALRTNRSRCLFGSGIASGKDRATCALRNALSSPLLDQGSLLKETQTVLIHLCGGENLTLYEIELLMQRLQKFIPEKAHMLFGAAIDPSMGDSLSLTLISALPEDALTKAPRDSLSHTSEDSTLLDPSQGFTPHPHITEPSLSTFDFESNLVETTQPESIKAVIHSEKIESTLDFPFKKPEKAILPTIEPATQNSIEGESTPELLLSKFRKSLVSTPSILPSLFDDDRPFAESTMPVPQETRNETPDPELFITPAPVIPPPEPVTLSNPNPIFSEPEIEIKPPQATFAEFISANTPENPDVYAEIEPTPDPIANDEDFNILGLGPSGFTHIPKKRPQGVLPKVGIIAGPPEIITKPYIPVQTNDSPITTEPVSSPELPPAEIEIPKLKLGIKIPSSKNELSFDSSPRGRFEGAGPNVIDGEDLDLPPFLRKKK